MNLNITLATRIGLNLCAIFGITAALFLGSSIFIPIVFSVLLASVLFPFAKFMHERLHLPWFFACLTALLGLVALHLVVIGAFAWAIPKTIVGLPQDEQAWIAQYNTIQSNLSQLFPIKDNDEFFGRYDLNRTPPKAVSLVRKQLTEEQLSSGLVKLSVLGLDHLWQAILVLFVTLFLLLEGQMLADKVKAIFGPSLEIRGRVTVALAEMSEAIRTYLVWRTIVNLGLALVLGSVYWYLGLKHWYLWALLVAVLSYVPYIGTIAAGIPPLVDALLFVDPYTAPMGSALLTAFGIAVFYTCVVTFEGYIIVPWVMGRSMDLNATTVLLACLYWHQVWGVAGLFLAMPLMAALKAICMQVEGWQGWGHLMGSGPAVELKLDNSATEKARLEAIEQAMGGNGEQTVVMDPNDDRKGAAQPGDTKSGGYAP
ncbi:AI-2E family transporter [Gemmata sp. G18]|uniref:AI-2E family transporter n=1 Tax=Gemmata palustris TaxID=2822762 RepID=A0ABS5BKT4_9BACT|nr:AI-2E family transporter [Gemmata palustris]MBP3954317.1 AI-2E family transporter [Gemmata palustris]